MFSWTTLFPFELPALGLPTFSIPANIQRRFLSFILRRFLGRFLRPGQLEGAQIDAQIGNGSIEITNIELADEGVNEIIGNLPVRLKGGSISRISAKVPWGRIWSSPLEVTIHGLDLNIVMTKSSPTSTASDLVVSVSDVAETFVHEELDARENQALRDSIIQTRPEAPERYLPGAIDPFMADDYIPEGADNAVEAEEVSILTSLTERLLSRLKVSITSSSITIINPHRSQLKINIPDVVFATEESLENGTSNSLEPPVRAAVTRSIRISSLVVKMTDLTSHGRLPYLVGAEESDSSSSSEDEMAQMNMSQSILSLPMESSVYHSAASLPPRASLLLSTPRESIILSTADPLVFQATSHSSASMQKSGSMGPKVNIQATLGIMACAFESWNVREFSAFTQYLVLAPAPKPAPTPDPQTYSFRDTMKASLSIRAVVALLLAPLATKEHTYKLSAFYQYPLHPFTSSTHSRLQVDHIEAALSKTVQAESKNMTTSTTASISDTFIIYFRNEHHQTSSSISPILILDPHLPSASGNEVFPFIDLINEWEKNGTMLRPSVWRARAPAVKRDIPSASISSKTGKRSGLTFASGIGNDDSHITLLPVHIFVDLEVVQTFLLPYLDGLTPLTPDGDDDDDNFQANLPHEEEHDLGRAEGPQADEAMMETPRPRVLEIEDDNTSPPGAFKASRKAVAKRLCLSCTSIRLEIRPPPSVLRGKHVLPRSGMTVLDIYGIRIAAGGRSRSPDPSSDVPTRHATFSASPGDRGAPVYRENPTINAGEGVTDVEWDEVVVGFAPVGGHRAASLLAIGPLKSLSSSIGGKEFGTVGESPEIPLRPRIAVWKASPSGRSSTESAYNTRDKIFIHCNLPQLRVSLHKAPLDGLQLWADDLNQWIERVSLGPTSLFTGQDELAESLIGSRFFSRRAKSLSSSTTTGSSFTKGSTHKSENLGAEVIIKVTLTEVSLQLWIPRENGGVFESSSVRPMRLAASDVFIEMHSKPHGKNETVVSLSVFDMRASDMTASDDEIQLLGLSKPRAINSEPTPMLLLRFASVSMSDTVAKESRIKVTLYGFTFSLSTDIAWMSDLAAFAKAPEGAFESVVPSERTLLTVQVIDCSVQARTPKHDGSLAVALNDITISTDIVGNSPKTIVRLKIGSLWLFCIDDLKAVIPFRTSTRNHSQHASDFWKRSGFAHFLEMRDFRLDLKRNTAPGNTVNKVELLQVDVLLSVCADSLSVLGGFVSDFTKTISPPQSNTPKRRREGTVLRHESNSNMMLSVDENAFKRPPEFGSDVDMIRDDLPSNTEYLDAEFGSAAGFRDFSDDDLEDFSDPEQPGFSVKYPRPQGSSAARETISIINPLGVRPVEYYFDNLVPEDLGKAPHSVDTAVRVHNCNITMSLHSGYDWLRTQHVVNEEVEAMRRKLIKIRQLVSAGKEPQYQSPDTTHTLLFNSVYIGLPPEVDDLDGDALIAAIDEQLEDDADETASQESWQTLRKPNMPPTGDGRPTQPSARLARSKRPSIQFCFMGLEAEYDLYPPDTESASRLLLTVKNFEILDHIRTSTWRKFLTQKREDSRGNVPETDSDMLRIELISVRPVSGDTSEELRLRAKILPLRLHVDQDALDFIKKFFAFSDPDQVPQEPSPPDETFFQHVDVFPVDLRLDYKPKRVDYRALREGRTIELMNFFHFDGSEMTLRHIEMFGITGWNSMLETLNDLWTPDVKAHQLAEVISGVEPIRSFVNVGSGVADLVLLPIAQYKKDGRILRGLQKGAQSFVQSTAIEAITIGARLANGTQVILEQAEGLLGGSGRTSDMGSSSRWETIGVVGDQEDEEEGDDDTGYNGIPDNMTMSLADLSRYADQPANVREGLQLAYQSLGRNIGAAAQTILAVPMEVYERSGNEGHVRAVVRAIPVAVLKPMIGASEAVSKTLLGLRGTLNPSARRDLDEKYKTR